MARYNVLSTKKIDSRLLKEAARDGIRIIEEDFIVTLPVEGNEVKAMVREWVIGSGHQAAIFTSSHAVENTVMLAGKATIPLHWKIYCLSGATQKKVLDLLPGSEIIGSASDARSLGKTIVEQGLHKRLVFFCSDKRRDDLPDLLKESNIELNEVVVYRTVETPVKIFEQIDAVLFFSPSGVSSFFSLNKLEESTVCFAIGATTEKAVSLYTKNKVIICQAPGLHLMINEVRKYFQHNN